MSPTDAWETGPVAVQNPRTTATIEIRIARDAAALRGLYPDPGLGAFFHYASTAPRWTFATIEYVLGDGGTAFLACHGNTIVGYLVLARPANDQPWGRLPGLAVREVSVEVAREWRQRGLAGRLFAAMLADPGVDDLILLAAAYRWCWDLDERAPGRLGGDAEGTAYSRRLLALFAAAGFTRRPTNEPNIAMDSRNFLAVRAGARVPGDWVDRFEATLFAPAPRYGDEHEHSAQGGAA